MRGPRLLLVQPGSGPSFWGLEHALELARVRYSNAPLPLLTLAALTPGHWQVELADENVRPVDLDAPCDVVGLTAMNVHAPRAFALADAFRRRGRTVVMGGPFATIQPERCAPHVDVLFTGDAERTWPRFCRDYECGSAERSYHETEPVELTESPVPRYDLVRPGDYACLPIQTTRGCPYMCEFCDVIVLQGRRVRTKPVEQVLRELDAARRAGAGEIFFVDDNLIGNRKHVRALLAALRRHVDETGYRPLLFSQASLDLAEQPELLEGMVRAGFTRIFIGIESPRQSSLRESGKRQNLHGELLERIAAIQRVGLVIWAGMVIGFDHDDIDVFAEQAQFLDEAGIAVAMVGMLNAPARTPLYERLARAGRIYSPNDWVDQCAWTNVVPARMSRAELFRGYAELIRELYAPERYARRVLGGVARMGPAIRGTNSARWPTRADRERFVRALGWFTLSRDQRRRRHFAPNLLRVAASQPERFVEAVIHLGLWRHFETFVPRLSDTLEETAAAELPHATRTAVAARA